MYHSPLCFYQINIVVRNEVREQSPLFACPLSSLLVAMELWNFSLHSEIKHIINLQKFPTLLWGAVLHYCSFFFPPVRNSFQLLQSHWSTFILVVCALGLLVSCIRQCCPNQRHTVYLLFSSGNFMVLYFMFISLIHLM